MSNIWLALILFLAVGCRNGMLLNEDKRKAYINELEQNGLYNLAAAEYEKLAEEINAPDAKKANILYLAGNMYFDNAGGYEKALSCYLKAKVLGPGKGIKNELERKVIACLENMGKSYDAQKKLDRITALAPEGKSKAADSGKIIAKIGEKIITMSDLENEIRSLPAYMQKEYADPKKKLEFLKQYIAVELMYDSALRKGFDRDPELNKAAEKIKKNIMVEKLISEEVSSKVDVSDEEIKYYYEANKDKMKTKEGSIAPLGSVKEQISSAIKNEKAQSEYAVLFDKLMRAKKVEIYEEAF